nr:glycerophosphodiester phosphodiesterase family protein [Alpinimonas psychrophila]
MAHRGLALEVDENTLAAFGAALAAGAQIIETDVRATADGIPVLVHDEVLPTGARIADLTWAELQAVPLPRGGSIPSLDQALAFFPEAKFNIDVKSSDAILPTVLAITNASATDRVLIASFSRARQRRTLRLLAGVASSASAMTVLGAVLAGKVGWVALMRYLLRHENAVQIPLQILSLRTTSLPMIRHFHAAGVEVHIWTVNEERDMIALKAAGVDGIVTDRCDVAHRVFAL